MCKVPRRVCVVHPESQPTVMSTGLNYGASSQPGAEGRAGLDIYMKKNEMFVFVRGLGTVSSARQGF